MDTWAGNNHDPVTLHKYLYANANPVMYTDPSGYMSLASVSAGMNGMASLGNITRVSAIVARKAVNKTIGATLRIGSKKLVKQQLRKLRKCIRKKNKCGLGVNLLIVGFDNPSMMAHIRDAQALNPRSHLLTYDPNKRGSRNWYKGKGGCAKSLKPGITYQCDEYPFFKTKEGGAENAYRVSLRWVPGSENMSVGAHFGYLARKMRKPGASRKFVVVVSHELPSIALPK